MGTRRLLPIAFALLMGVSALAQGPTYGVGRTPTAEEIRAWDISIGPTGEELPPGRGTVKEGAQVYRAKCAGCHGVTGIEGNSPILKSKAGPDVELWARGQRSGVFSYQADLVRHGSSITFMRGCSIVKPLRAERPGPDP